MKRPSLLFFAVIALTCCTRETTTPLRLWYTEPADASAADNPNGWQNDPEWLKAFPVGNGFMGAMVFGDAGLERIQLNEKSLWSGSYDDNDNPDAYASLGKIRELLFAGKYSDATELTMKTQVCRGAEWKDGKLINCEIKSLAGRDLVLRYAGKEFRSATATGKTYKLNGELHLN